jgi:hypothetical protein
MYLASEDWVREFHQTQSGAITPPLRPDATPAEQLAMQRQEDWASREVAERIGDRFFDSSHQFKAVRALREGRQAFLVFSGSYADQCFGCIANDHGEEAARAWVRGDGDLAIEQYYGPYGAGVNLGTLFLERSCVVIDPQPASVVLQHARAA